MATKQGLSKDGAPRIEGHVRLEAVDAAPSDIRLAAYAFDEEGKLLGAADLDGEGRFRIEPGLKQPQAVEVLIARAGDALRARKSSLYVRRYKVDDWRNGVLQPGIFVPKVIWWPWWPKRICISGHVRKVPGNCPVPFAKVEIFDVDRLFCLWPYIYPLREKLAKLRVARIEELLKVPPEPFPGPLPEEVQTPVIPLPPPSPDLNAFAARSASEAALGPQPEPPDEPLVATAFSQRTPMAETTPVDAEVLKNISDVTFTSKLAPWVLFPRCFYTRDLICTTSTDENGYFRCCFDWWPLQFRLGRLKLDWRPDIVIRVTQVIDGVEHVLYIDPISNTRWNVTNAHIDIFVDDPDIVCGGGDPQDRPAGTQVFFTRIGNDEVYWIDQASGLYEKPPWSNTAYGKALRVHAQFGDTISTGGAIPGASAPYYYRLSYSLDGTNFTPITTQLKDTRVHKGTLMSTSHTLGPHTVGSEPALYEVRDFQNYYWYNPDWIGHWITANINSSGNWTKLVPDGKYSLRLEVFDATGMLLNATKVDYRDGTVSPPAVLPPLYPCDLVITIDNNAPSLSMTISPSPPGCGVIKASAVPPLDVNVQVSQANNHLFRWRLQYTKGVSPAVHVLDGDLDYSGLAPANVTVNAMPMLTGVTTTCAFALKLWAYANVRNGYGLIWYREIINAIAVEKCPSP